MTTIRGAAMAAAFALLPAAAQAQAEHKCAMNAYINDEDPKGVNVRAGPSNQAKIVRVIKRGDTMVRIVAEQNGWFRVDEILPVEGTDVKLNGWLHGSRLAAGLMIMQAGKAEERLLEEPSDRSKTLLLLHWAPVKTDRSSSSRPSCRGANERSSTTTGSRARPTRSSWLA
jgi:SH3-like domain-containing protein